MYKHYNTHHIRCGSEDREEVNRNSTADEHGRGQGSEALAAGAAGFVLACVEPDHHAALLQVCKTLLQIATEALRESKYLFINTRYTMTPLYIYI